MNNILPKLKAIALFMSAMITVAIFGGCDYFIFPSEVRRSLKAAGENKSELIAVIDHFKHDSEKLEAAYYLISNMPGHYSIGGQDVFDPAFDQIKPILKEKGIILAGQIFTKLIDSIRHNSITSFVVEEDIKTISSDYLIKNIDLAFNAYFPPQISHNLYYEKNKHVNPYRYYGYPIVIITMSIDYFY